jgi:4-oxalmesaconate hydratase
MIIDVHGHVSPPNQLYAYQAGLLHSRGAHGRGSARISDDDIVASHNAKNPNFGNISHIEHLDEAGIDMQLISPRPFTLMHSEDPAIIIDWFTEETNNIIYRTTQLFPDRFRGMCSLPQTLLTDPTHQVDELRRCVNELGFVGAMINPDPAEGGVPTAPGLGDRYWYPFYEALCELDVPALVHSASCRAPARESYTLHFIVEETIAIASLLNSKVYEDFPSLKLIFSHGGGAIPYQLGRFQAFWSMHESSAEAAFSKMMFETCLYTKESIELLIKTVGVNACLFGSEKPGTGSSRNPVNGRFFDDIKFHIDQIEWLSNDDRDLLYEGNARRVFNRLS